MKCARFVSIPVFSVFLVLGFVYYITIFVFLEDWLGLQSSAGSLNALIFTYLACFSLFSFLVCVLTDPGGVPSAYVPDVEDSELSDQDSKKTVQKRWRQVIFSRVEIVRGRKCGLWMLTSELSKKRGRRQFLCTLKKLVIEGWNAFLEEFTATQREVGGGSSGVQIRAELLLFHHLEVGVLAFANLPFVWSLNSVPGKHLGISKSDAQKYIVPYLEDEASVKDSTGRHTYSRVRGVHHGVSQSRTEMQIVNHTEGDASAQMMLDGLSSYSWPASVTSFFDELLGFANDESSPRVVR
ncbi:hypothetical protein TEA_026286 [Camellia sinensis var. sinensis]|uniref:Uncharacterized protein n=1 Tax=Camellia sinensis var. sinensis TaxID=542762 RepID=A0A4S4DCC3_CAMSN|nr:hypothetical protein TEA_026286 [Camellia sinensis var. sinensis]